MCDIRNETDLQEAVVYKVVTKYRGKYRSPYTKTPFTIGAVIPMGRYEFDDGLIIWNDKMRGRITEGWIPTNKLKLVHKWLKAGKNRENAERIFFELNPRLKK